MENTCKETLDNWLPISDFLELFPHIWPSRKSFDWFQHQRAKNGMAKFHVTCKVGRRVLVNPTNCVRWMEWAAADE